MLTSYDVDLNKDRLFGMLDDNLDGKIQKAETLATGTMEWTDAPAQRAVDQALDQARLLSRAHSSEQLAALDATSRANAPAEPW